jgi:hypothetical protein
VRARKPELSAEAITAQLATCLQLTLTDPRFVAIDANLPTAVIADEVLRHIEAVRERRRADGPREHHLRPGSERRPVPWRPYPA